LDVPPPLTTKQTVDLAMTFCILWFIANWSINASLNYTTAASAMILSSTSGALQCYFPMLWASLS
jgi:solute carrier family 35 protein F5